MTNTIQDFIEEVKGALNKGGSGGSGGSGSSDADLSGIATKVDNLRRDVNALKSVTYVEITADEINTMFAN